MLQLTRLSGSNVREVLSFRGLLLSSLYGGMTNNIPSILYKVPRGAYLFQVRLRGWRLTREGGLTERECVWGGGGGGLL